MSVYSEWKDNYVSLLNDKLDVENEKSRLDKFAAKSKLSERGWQIPCKISTYIYGSVLFNQEFAYITTFEYRRPIAKTFAHFSNYKNRRQTDDNDDDNT